MLEKTWRCDLCKKVVEKQYDNPHDPKRLYWPGDVGKVFRLSDLDDSCASEIVICGPCLYTLSKLLGEQ